MALEQSFQEHTTHFESDEDVSLKQKWKTTSAPTTAPDNVNGCFECNICLDSANDPVVTLCGHLYCWPCIYKWLNVQNTSPESHDQPKCPVCKSNISSSSLVPLYGRGKSSPESNSKRPQLGLVIPRRPPALGATLHSNQNIHPDPFQSQPPQFHHRQVHHQLFPHPYGNYASMESNNIGGVAMTSVFRPTAGIFGEMVFARIFGGSDPSLLAYPYQNSYLLMGSGSPRMRRQELQAGKSLNRVSIFLFCCFILCLLLF